VVQAGASEQGRELAAAMGDIVYAIHPTKECANYFRHAGYASI